MTLSQASRNVEPSTPPRVNLEGMEKLMRVSHLTLVAQQLSDKNQPSYLLDMPRIRDLDLDVREEELPMLRKLIREENCFEFEEACRTAIKDQKTKEADSKVTENNEAEEEKDTKSVSSVELFDMTRPKPFGYKMTPSKFQPTLSSPRLKSVNIDATMKLKRSRDGNASNNNSPVIKAKIPKRSSLSQEMPILQG